MSTPRIEIDWTRCDGHGLCARLLPERITLDEWGFPVIGDELGTEEAVTAAKLAARTCPALALRVE